MSETVSGIARRRMEGRKPGLLEPYCLDPKLVNGFVVRAVCWMAALRERLRARAGVKPAGGGGERKPRAPRPALGEADRDGDDVSERDLRWAAAAAKRLGIPAGDGEGEDDADWADRWAAARKAGREAASAPHRAMSLGGALYDLRELSRPVRVDAVNLAYGREAIGGLSDAVVIAQVCSDLVRAAKLLDNEEDVAAIHALARAALSLCPPEDVEAVTLLARSAGERTVLEILTADDVPSGAVEAPEASGCGPPDG